MLIRPSINTNEKCFYLERLVSTDALLQILEQLKRVKGDRALHVVNDFTTRRLDPIITYVPCNSPSSSVLHYIFLAWVYVTVLMYLRTYLPLVHVRLQDILELDV
jgi:hypothetical protein